MGAMFRSEEMVLVQMFVQPEAAYECLSELGEAGTVQFRDCNEGVNAFQRRFVAEVRRCDEMTRKMRFIEEEMVKAGIPVPRMSVLPRAPNREGISYLEGMIDQAEREIREMVVNGAALRKQFNRLTELRHVLYRTEQFFQESKDAEKEPLHPVTYRSGREEAGDRGGKLGFVSGVLRRQRVPAFERMLWRVSRGNVYLRLADLDHEIANPYTGVRRAMTAFVVFYQGEQLRARVDKICAGFHAKMYPCPESQAERTANLRLVDQQIKDMEEVLKLTKENSQQNLLAVKYLAADWHVQAKKMKAIYHTLNLFNVDVTHNQCYIGECWVPTSELSGVQNTLKDGTDATGGPILSFLNIIETNRIPPTFNKTNKFTKGFQNLIDAYGIATYREVNPALHSIITFPFLFAVMFGDLGHGLIMAFFGAWMCCSEKKLMQNNSDNEIWNIFFSGRYIIMLMGLFSMYTGVVYNDLFCKSMNVFGSSWRNPYDHGTLQDSKVLTLDPYDSYEIDEPYLFGMDPIWQLADNKIIFLNSYKMKLSIIFGVVHMIFGVCMSVSNYNYFKNRASIFLEFLPQIMFLVLLFLYMVFMIVYKWIAYSVFAADDAYKPGCAASVLILFINMMLFSSNEVEEGCKEFMFEGQGLLQLAFVLVALGCIPVMLLGKPLYVIWTQKNKTKEVPEQKRSHTSTGDDRSAKPALKGEKEEEPLSEIMIHQGIHTIEYVLSTISHTASYLRLWALSLAHAELSDVLWHMVLSQGLKSKNWVGGIKLYFSFGAWAFFTLAILVMMEGLSAFLHTLRLHWVEFMSKFYGGHGYKFEPFSLAPCGDIDNDKDEEKPF